MSNISIPNLIPTGSELFTDDESFMTDLNEQEFSNVSGGLLESNQELTPFSPGTPVVSISPVVKFQSIAKVAYRI
ncbi:hypothetical protein [Pseudanabaena sp. PCC 6802]|uniref:hypothetical protein n=1 Tax=Pseudanabaena sp. PCC 6802 TaxID=118173 RepID=UPI00034C1072|nr:hypothetical protein [Pseudanabaena sp. PCC 6802]